jgi:hypothetical protein
MLARFLSNTRGGVAPLMAVVAVLVLQLPESWRHMDRKYLDVVQRHLDDNGNMDTEGTQHLERLRDGPRQLGRPGYCV